MGLLLVVLAMLVAFLVCVFLFNLGLLATVFIVILAAVVAHLLIRFA